MEFELKWTSPQKSQDKHSEVTHIETLSAHGKILRQELQKTPMQVSYDLEWDRSWRLQEAFVECTFEEKKHALNIVRTPQGLLRVSYPTPALETQVFEGCDDIDLWPTPFTNTFPIRRLNLDVGEKQRIQVLYIESPLLKLSLKPQRYTYLGKGRYLFESLEDGFKATLQTDEQGFVLNYPDLFERSHAKTTMQEI